MSNNDETRGTGSRPVDTNAVHELLLSRRSIRAFTSEPVSDAQVQALLEAAMAAPSANNRKPWQFVAVRQAELRQKLAQTHRYSGMAAQSPLVIVVLAEEETSIHFVPDTSAATQNILLQAVAMGLGAVWVGIYPYTEREAYVREALDIPDSLRVLCLIPIGHPAEKRSPRTQFDPAKVHYDRYGGKGND